MKLPIFWIDEDRAIWEQERALLEALGWDVVAIPNASEGLEAVQGLSSPSEVQLIILDVMLVPGPNFALDNPGRIKTGNDTGLVFADTLFEMDAGFGEKLLLFSCAAEANHIKRIRQAAETIGGKYAPKNEANQDLGFIKLLLELGLLPRE